MNRLSPLVSVIINCHNGSEFLKEALNSVYYQTYKNWEIIFFDNASTDQSSKIAESFDSRLKYFNVDNKISLGDARNKALSKAKGEYIAFLDCDDSFLPNKLQDQVSIISQYDFDMCYGSAYYIDINSEILRKRKVSNKNGQLFSSLLIKYDINMQTVMIKKAILDKHNLNFDSSLMFAPDYDLFMEIALIGKTLSLKKYLSNYRIHQNSLSHKSQNLVCSEGFYTLNRLQKKYSDTPEKYKFSLKYARSIFRVQEAISYLQNNNSTQAKKVLNAEFVLNPKILFLLFLLFIRFSPRAILKIIRRTK